MPDSATPKRLPRFHGSTFESMVEAFAQSFGPFESAPLGRTRDFHWSADFWTSGPATLVTSCHQADCFMRATADTAEYLSIVVPRTGGKDEVFGRRRVEGRPGDMLLTNTHEPERVILRGGPITLDGLLLDQAIIAQAVAAIFEIPLNGTLDLAPVLTLSSSEGRLIGGLAQIMIDGMRHDGPLLHSPVAMSNLTGAFADLVVRLVPNRLSHLLHKKPHRVAPWHVRRAIDFMHANIAEPLTIPMIAEAVGVSIRALESGFRAFRETTPAAYLRDIRLRAAREDLLNPSSRRSVREISLKWGFFHFGRFSMKYRAVYGESPSDTKKRSAGL